MNNVHYQSNSIEYETPQHLFDKLNKEFIFTLDPCCTEQNRKCETYYTKKEDGLVQDWTGHIVFMNPPYGREIGKWIRKAHHTSCTSLCPVVCLLPSRTDTKWWHEYVMQADEIRFIKGRLKFGNCKNSAPFPSCIVVFRNVLSVCSTPNTPVCSSF